MAHTISRVGAVLIGVFLSITGSTNGHVKVWLPNTNYNNPKNWDGGNVPCANDRVVFSREKDVPVFVQDGISATELILPLNGELILSSHSVIRIGRQYGAPCEGKDAKFVAGNAFHWFDPTNWQIKDDWGNLTGATADGSTTSPVPDAQRVPCALDDVVFPPNATFKLILDATERASVQTITVNGQTLTQSALEAFLSSETGQRQFKATTANVELKGANQCSPEERSDNGCTCTNDERRQLSHICEYLSDKCPPPHCSDPVRPSASCCPICGSLLKVETQWTNFNFGTLKRHIGTFFARYPGVSGYMFTTNGQLQIILTHTDPRGSQSFAQTLLDDLSGSYNKILYGIKDVSLETTTTSTSALMGNLNGGMSSGNVAALIIGLMAASVIGILFYTQRQRLMPLAFRFGRFENDVEDELAVEMSPTSGSASVVRPRTTGAAAVTDVTIKGFENPFYDTKCTDPMPFGPKMATAADTFKAPDPGENPGYLAFDRVEDIPAPTNTDPWLSEPTTPASSNVPLD